MPVLASAFSPTIGEGVEFVNIYLSISTRFGLHVNGGSGKKFATRLRAARELRGLSQVELAKRANMQGSSIAHFEGGTRKPSFDNFVRIVSALEITADYLIGRTEDPAGPGKIDRLTQKLNMLSSDDRDLASDILDLFVKRRGKT